MESIAPQVVPHVRSVVALVPMNGTVANVVVVVKSSLLQAMKEVCQGPPHILQFSETIGAGVVHFALSHGIEVSTIVVPDGKNLGRA